MIRHRLIVLLVSLLSLLAPAAHAFQRGGAQRVADIKEASAKTSTRALEAALVETNAGFFLSGKDLIALDDAGVPDTVLDVIVGLTYGDDPRVFLRTATRSNPYRTVLRLWDEHWQSEEMSRGTKAPKK